MLTPCHPRRKTSVEMKHEPLFQVLTEIVEVICRRHLDDLRVFSENIGGAETLVVMPHVADYPRLVGRHGGCVHAIEYLVNKTAGRIGERIGFSLRESFVGDREPVEAFVYNPDFDVKSLHRRLIALAGCVSGVRWKFKISSDHEYILVTVPVERSRDTETFLSALEAVFKPACYGDGRKLQIKPKFINHTYEHENSVGH